MIKLPSITVVASTVCVFVIAGLIVFGSTFGHEFVSWDDELLIVDNPNVHDISAETIKNVFTTYDPELYVPLTLISYQIDDAIGDGAPLMTHVVNRMLHLLNALLVTWLLFALIQRGWLAIGLGLIFLLHPLNTEAAVWASSRKDLLSTFFCLSSLLVWLRHRESPTTKLYVCSLLLFLLGLLSKVMVVTLPIIMILIDLLDGKGISRASLKEKAPFFIASIVFGIIGLFGKTDVLAASTGLQKILVASKATVFYATKFFAPYGLSAMYPYTESITMLSPDFLIPLFIIICAVGVLWRFSSHNRLVTFGALFFVVTLVPTFTNFSKGGDFYIASDRYSYIPMIGLLAIVGACVRTWMDIHGGMRIRASRRNALLTCSCCILLLFGYLSSVQAAVWKNNTTLYQDILNKYPNARAAHNNLGMELYESGNYVAAIAAFDRASAIHKDVKTDTNKAAALVGLGRLDEAKIVFESSLALSPGLTDALYGIGNIYQKKGNLQAAAEQYRKTLDLDPHHMSARNNLGITYILLKDWNNAMKTLKEVIKQKPDFLEPYYNLAGVYEETGLKNEAEEMYQKSLELSPRDADALSRLATLLYDRGEIDEAAELLSQALSIDSSNQTATSLVLRMRKDGTAQ